MQRVGILTYIYAINHGSVLQAKAVESIAKSLFPTSEVKFINYAPRRGLLKELKNNLLNRRLISGFKIVNKFRTVINRDFDFFSSLQVTDDVDISRKFLEAEKLDICIVGSDTVWESRPSHSGYAPPPDNIYFTSERNLPNTKFVSISASSDRSPENIWPACTKKAIACNLNSYSYISVRDKFTAELLNSFGVDRKIDVLPDPTFFVNYDKCFELDSHLKKLLGSQPYVVLDISDRKLSLHFRELFNEYFPGLSVVSPMTNRYADINLRGKIEPLQWVSLHANSKFNATNRFHGTVFSMRSGTPFAAIDESFEYALGAGSKKADLLERAGLSDRLFSKSDRVLLARLKDLISKDANLGDQHLNRFETHCHQINQAFKADWTNILSKISAAVEHHGTK